MNSQQHYERCKFQATSLHDFPRPLTSATHPESRSNTRSLRSYTLSRDIPPFMAAIPPAILETFSVILIACFTKRNGAIIWPLNLSVLHSSTMLEVVPVYTM